MDEDEPTEDRSDNGDNITIEQTSNTIPSNTSPDEMHTDMDHSLELGPTPVTNFYFTSGIVVSI